MAEEDYKKVLKYIVDKLNAGLPKNSYVLVESPFVFIINVCYAEPIIFRAIGGLYANNVCSKTHREYFELLKTLCRSGSRSEQYSLMPDRLYSLVNSPMHQLLVGADLAEQ